MTMSENEHSDLPLSYVQRLRWGLRWGLIYVVIFGGLAAFLRVIDGPQSFVEHGTSLQAFLEAYLVAGVTGGVVLGLAKPWLKSVLVSAIVGAIIGCLIGFALLLSNGGLKSFSSFDLLLPGVFGLCACVVAVKLNGRAKQMGKL